MSLPLCAVSVTTANGGSDEVRYVELKKKSLGQKWWCIFAIPVPLKQKISGRRASLAFRELQANLGYMAISPFSIYCWNIIKSRKTTYLGEAPGPCRSASSSLNNAILSLDSWKPRDDCSKLLKHETLPSSSNLFFFFFFYPDMVEDGDKDVCFI